MDYFKWGLNQYKYLSLYIHFVSLEIFKKFLLKLSLQKSDYFIYKLSISPFVQFTRISETIPLKVVEDIFLTVTDRDQISDTEYYYTCRILVSCCDPKWLLPYKQPWASKITLFWMFSWVYLTGDHLFRVMIF